ncbi:hypothetical protein L228DRAFT_258412 [Xylona heveae TC161]|uniref:YTH domain-containing protein n=1 Tax=Xylona heveae (strain CBS 132557 / TC161) TaxID=1328760 RepID=A0A165IHK8_XYLHT|nr:hypothetical protein L228DRAFT_258412 [Xylona heveae TC161]KZF24908.1 hypothetical protein L228DRAFT_258412 [Xylona heveae TC161]
MASYKERMKALQDEVGRSGSQSLKIKIPTPEELASLSVENSSFAMKGLETCESEDVHTDTDATKKDEVQRKSPDSCREGYYFPKFIEEGDPMMDEQRLTTFSRPRMLVIDGKSTMSLGGPSPATSGNWFNEATTPLKDSFESQKIWWGTIPNENISPAHRIRAAVSDEQPRTTYRARQLYADLKGASQVFDSLPLMPSSRSLKHMQLVAVAESSADSMRGPDQSPGDTFLISPSIRLNTIDENPISLKDDASASSKNHIVPPQLNTFSGPQKKESVKGPDASPAMMLESQKVHASTNPGARFHLQGQAHEDPFFDDTDPGGAKYIRSKTLLTTNAVASAEKRYKKEMAKCQNPGVAANNVVDVNHSSAKASSQIQDVARMYGFQSSIPPLILEKNHNSFQFSKAKHPSQLQVIQSSQGRMTSYGKQDLHKMHVEMLKHPHMTIVDFLERFDKHESHHAFGSPKAIGPNQKTPQKNGHTLRRASQSIASSDRDRSLSAHWYLHQDYHAPPNGLAHGAQMSPPVWTQKTTKKDFRWRLAKGGHFVEGIPSAFQVLNVINPPYYQLPFGSIIFGIKCSNEVLVRASVQNLVWCSSLDGNRDLQEAWSCRRVGAKLMIMFYVAGSGKICGLAEIWGPFSHTAKPPMFNEGETLGAFPLQWIYCKDVPLSAFGTLYDSSTGKYVINFSDATPFPEEVGRQAVRIYVEGAHISNILTIERLNCSNPASPKSLQPRTPRRRASSGLTRTPSTKFDIGLTPSSHHTASATPVAPSPFKAQPYLEGSGPESAKSIQKDIAKGKLSEAKKSDQPSAKKQPRKLSFAKPGRKAGSTNDNSSTSQPEEKTD